MKKYEKHFKVFQNNIERKKNRSCSPSKSWKGTPIVLYEVSYNNEISERRVWLEDISGCVFNYDNGSMKCQIIDSVEEDGYGCSRWHNDYVDIEVFVTLQAAKEYIKKNKLEKIERLEKEILKLKKELK